MSVPKRLRYEVLRRDGHTCRYCGGQAPDVKLTVDHVIPVALGGADDPSNLVTACADCNAGKSSVPVDAPLVEEVAEDALRWSEAMRVAAYRQALSADERDAYLEFFTATWERWTYKCGEERRTFPLPTEWPDSVDVFWRSGIDHWVIEQAVDKAMRKRNLRGEFGEFKYMCGVVWGTLRERQAIAANYLRTETVA